jgi:tetratricopeptide (TPR) repeat protein
MRCACLVVTAETTLELQWEDLAIPVAITAKPKDSYITHLRRELTGINGFDYRAYMAAAQFCIQTNSNLEQGLKWADAAIGMPSVGQSNFDTLSTKAQLLAKLGKPAEAKTTMQVALQDPATTAIQIHQYGRLLVAAHQNAEALEIFKLNAQRHGDAWPVHVGLARGYSATGDIPAALEHARKALPQAPDDLNRNGLEAMIKTLSEGHPISQ